VPCSSAARLRRSQAHSCTKVQVPQAIKCECVCGKPDTAADPSGKSCERCKSHTHRKSHCPFPSRSPTSFLQGLRAGARAPFSGRRDAEPSVLGTAPAGRRLHPPPRVGCRGLPLSARRGAPPGRRRPWRRSGRAGRPGGRVARNRGPCARRRAGRASSARATDCPVRSAPRRADALRSAWQGPTARATVRVSSQPAAHGAGHRLTQPARQPAQACCRLLGAKVPGHSKAQVRRGGRQPHRRGWSPAAAARPGRSAGGGAAARAIAAASRTRRAVAGRPGARRATPAAAATTSAAALSSCALTGAPRERSAGPSSPAGLYGTRSQTAAGASACRRAAAAASAAAPASASAWGPAPSSGPPECGAAAGARVAAAAAAAALARPAWNGRLGRKRGSVRRRARPRGSHPLLPGRSACRAEHGAASRLRGSVTASQGDTGLAGHSGNARARESRGACPAHSAALLRHT
jgi:hypothetical protein